MKTLAISLLLGAVSSRSTYAQPSSSRSTYKQPSSSWSTYKQPSSSRSTYKQPSSSRSTYKQPSSSRSTYAQPSIWDESIEQASDVCGDHWARWKDKSNSWDTYVEYLTQAEKVFEDDFFSASMDSIYSLNAPPAGGQPRIDRYNQKVIGWKRPQDIYPDEGKPNLLGSLTAMKPMGIKQGMLSDCWFLSAVCAVAEKPERLNRVINQYSRQDYNFQGIFRYYFWNYNEWVGINIDDRLPIRYMYSNSKDYFAPFAADKSNFGAFWMPLLEKAFAKFNGNYDRIEWGSGFESLRILSNKPVYFFQHKKLKKMLGSEEELFNLLHKLSREDYPMVASCCATKKKKAPDGLTKSHAYSLLDVVDLEGTRLAKLRNPWSKEGYNGKWSDDDPVWTPELLKKAGHTLANDGVFYMPFENYIGPEYFRSTSVAIFKKFAKRNLYTLNQKVAQQALRVSIPSKQVVYFTFEIENPRLQKNCKKIDQFINIYFFKGKTYQGDLIGKMGYLGGSMYHATTGMPDMEVEPGEYTLMIANWELKKNGPIDYSLSVYQEGTGKIGISM